jgi:Mn2+/Fe2+ NRAMP family transporter
MKLGVVTGNDLAKLCRIHYSKEVKFGLWIMAEIALIGAEI